MHSWPNTVLAPISTTPLVAADLGPVADPAEAAEADLGSLRDLELQVLAEEDGAVGLPAPAGGRQEPPPQVAPEQARVAPVEHAVAAKKRSARSTGGDPRFRPPYLDCAAGWRRRRSRPSPSACSRATSAPWRAAITLIENDDPAGWELVREVFPQHRQGPDRRPHRPAGRRQEHPDRRADRGDAKGRPPGRGALDRPLEPLHPRRAARRPHPALRPLPRLRASSSARWRAAARSAGSPRRPSRPRC